MRVQASLDYDLTIVGGGIVGTTLACALKGSGLRVLLVEAQPDAVAIAQGQAYAISLLSSQIFQGLGIWENLLPQITTCQEVCLSDGNYPEVVRFSPKDLGTPAVVYVAEHAVLLKSLQSALGDCPQVEFWCPATVMDIHYGEGAAELKVAIAGNYRTLRTQLVIAADGARSPLRTAAGIRTRGWQYWQSCIACVVQPELNHGNVAYERFWTSGPFGILPLPDNRCRIVWTAPHAEAQALAALDDDQFLVELTRRFGTHLGRLSLVGGRFVFPVQLMQCDRYVLPRLALVGDAAHCCHPVGGQGINLGIRDAAALAQVLRTAHQQGEALGSLQVLRRYDRWRRQENLAILGFTDFLDRCFSSTWIPVLLLRRLGLHLMQTIRPCKVFALKLMTGLMGRIPQIVVNVL